ncbi:MAG: N-acetylgalactosamine-6-sulfatase [Gemmatales bacterium]|nr:MAG: N-acetylgalactosamine-6-sulfatase [Gemmatales bacterium]
MSAILRKRNPVASCFGSLAVCCCLLAGTYPAQAAMPRPNIILMMADDLGWGDTGYNGHPVLKTPHLDQMAKEGLRFDRFYAAAPVCSPTRGSCLTGRHPYRYGILSANVGHLLPEELCLAEVLKAHGYITGHFGKWHLGTLTKTIKDSNRGGPKGARHFSPPWLNGFDVCFSTEAKVPTWNPMIDPKSGKPYGTYYWQQDGQRVRDNLDGDDSRVIMDRVIPFVQSAIRKEKPFFAVIWFHTPHKPCVAGPDYRKLYAAHSEEEQHYFGCITAMDEQIGRLRKTLSDAGAAGNTMIWFASDNGPENKAKPGSAGPFRGRKRDLYEGGIRVPGILIWPDKLKPRVVRIPCCSSDYFPTILDLLDIRLQKHPEPIDGISLKPLLFGSMDRRPSPIAFEFAGKLALNDNRYKLIRPGRAADFELYDIVADPGEKKNLAADKPNVLEAMKQQLLDWRKSCQRSAAGKDYSP